MKYKAPDTLDTSGNGQHVNADDVKFAATGRTLEILEYVAGIPREFLTDREGPCPWCAGDTRFRIMDRESGAVRCSHCFADKNGDFLSAIQHGRKVSFPEAICLAAEYLGMDNNGQASPDQVTDAITLLCRAKKIPSREALVAYGAAGIDAAGIVTLPAYGPDGQKCSTFTIKLRGDEKERKGKFEQGKPAGLFFPHEDGSERLPRPGETWHVVEGAKDAATLHHLGYRACGLNTCRLHPKFAPLFAGVDVVLVPDRDKASYAGAEETAKALWGHASSVRRADLPAEITDKSGKDVRDVLAGKDGEQLVRRAIEKARPVDGARVYSPDIITSAQFDAVEYPQTYIVEDVLVQGQPAICGGRSKSLKTGTMVDMAISLGTGAPFLGKFKTVPSRVLMLSGESGQRAIQETAKAVCKYRDVHLADARVSWGFKLPCICRQADLDVLGTIVKGESETHPNKIDVVVIDPAYLCLLDTSTKGLQASNLFDMGPLLLGLSEWGERTSTTVILCHHCRKGGNSQNPYAPPEREDLSMAGFHEWARQWLLLGRRSAYEQGSGHHELWLEVGGSAGHSMLLALNIDEGPFATRPAKQWGVAIMSPGDAKEQAQQSADQRKEDKRKELFSRQKAKVIKALRQCRDGETKRRLRELTAVNTDPLAEILMDLLATGHVEMTEITKNGTKYDGYKPTPLLLA